YCVARNTTAEQQAHYRAEASKFENITLRKQEEGIRHDQDTQLRVIFDQAAVGMARLDLDGYWIQVNQRLCDMLGYTMPELLTQTFAAIAHPDDAAMDVVSDRRLISGEVPQVSLEKRCLTQQGEVVWTYVTASTIQDTQGNLLYFIVTIQDVTARKQANLALQSKTEDLMRANLMLTNALEMLEQRNQELDQFAYVTSHDLKAPLRAIANLATWIEEDLGNSLPDENREQFELLKSRVHRMEGLINGLLEYSRIGRTRQVTEAVDVGALIEEIADSLSPLGAFTVETTSAMPILSAKRVLLSQVLSNLITNAIKHHHRSDGRVQVSARDLGSFYEFSVADDGPGIDPAYHRKIFTIFQTLQPRDDLESTGIGLSLVKKTVTAEGGNITLESAVGKGAIFRFTWPKNPRADN
ncbi:MAG: ATP-binding protein, partial [Phormidesmis sp.]